MKRIIFIMIALIGMISLSFGQTSSKTAAINVNSQSGEYRTTVDNISFNAGDTISNNDTLYAVIMPIDFSHEVKINCEVILDSISGTTTGVITTLKGKVWAGDTYTSINADTSAITGTGEKISVSTATAQRYRYYAVFIEVNTTGKILIDDVNCKYWY